jgi:predicted metal-dependent hydrolase
MECCSKEKNCGCGCGCYSQCNQSCCPCHTKQTDCSHSEEEKASYFLEVADEAWQEVLKDKIKEHILKTQNDRMDKLAKIVAEANNRRWKNKMEKKQGCMEFQESLCELFSQTKK